MPVRCPSGLFLYLSAGWPQTWGVPAARASLDEASPSVPSACFGRQGWREVILIIRGVQRKKPNLSFIPWRAQDIKSKCQENLY